MPVEPDRQIGAMSLNNKGAFVANIKFAYFDDSGKSKVTSKKSADIRVSETKQADPGDLGVPDGALCSMHVNVVWGKDKRASEAFLYSRGDSAVARYQVPKGATTQGRWTPELVEVISGMPVAPVQQIGAMSLENKGGFVANIQFAYFDGNGESHVTDMKSGDIRAGETGETDPGDFGVPDGTLCYLHVNVALGTDRRATEAFLYSKDDPAVARYQVPRGATTLIKWIPRLIEVS